MHILEKIIVTGGKDYKDSAVLWDVLNSFRSKFIVYEGDEGTGKLTKEYAEFFGIPCKYYPYAESSGRRVRNLTMLEENKDTEYILSFPGDCGEKCKEISKNMGFTIFETEGWEVE